jgi:hypothetical protein
MDIKELKVKNLVFDLGLSQEDFDKLKETIDGKEAGTTFVVKKGDSVYGIRYLKYADKYEIVSTPSDSIEKIPCAFIEGYFAPVDANKEDKEHMQFFLSEHYHAYRYDNDSYEDTKYLAKDVKTLKDKIMNKLLEDNKINNIETREIKHYFWLFDQEMQKEFLDPDSFACKNDDIRRILKVWEYKNHRFSLSLCSAFEDRYKIMIFNYDNPVYNYIDKGRLFYNNIYIWDLEEKNIDTNFLKKCQKHDEDMTLVTKAKYEQVKQRYRLKVQKEKEEEELKDTIKTQAKQKLKELEGNPITINGITFKSTGIYYQGQEISGKFSSRDDRHENISDFKEFVDYYVDFEELDTIDFNRLYEKFCEEISIREFEGILGNINVKVKKITSDATRHYINDIRINKDEVVEMLKRAICFDKEEDYRDLLKKVSKCNLRFHNIISNGLRIDFKDYDFIGNRHSDEKILKLTIVRKGKYNFLKLKDRIYRIKDTNRLLVRSTLNNHRMSTPSMKELIDLFSEMFGFSEEQVSDLFKEGLKEYEEAIKKSEQFLAETVKLFNVSEAEKDGHSGYLVTGKSGTRYLITKDLKIFEYNNMRYICVVDKDLGAGLKNDKLVNRIYALANDSLVARHIYTLKR